MSSCHGEGTCVTCLLFKWVSLLMIKAVITSDSLHPFHDLSQAFIYFFLFSDQIPQQTREQNTNLMQAVHSVTPQGTTALLCNIPVVTIS